MAKKLSHEHLIGLIIVIGLLGAAAWLFANMKDAAPGIPKDLPPATEEACAAADGSWNPCASACPDAGSDEVCIQICVEKCEF